MTLGLSSWAIRRACLQKTVSKDICDYLVSVSRRSLLLSHRLITFVSRHCAVFTEYDDSDGEKGRSMSMYKDGNSMAFCGDSFKEDEFAVDLFERNSVVSFT